MLNFYLVSFSFGDPGRKSSKGTGVGTNDRHAINPETAKRNDQNERNHRNDQNETFEAATEATETKQPKQPEKKKKKKKN